MRTIYLNQVQRLLREGLDLLFPPRCTCCQRNGFTLCPTCLQEMQPMNAPICRHCGAYLTTVDAACSFCQRHELRLNGLRNVHSYQGKLQHAIHALKYRGEQHLAEPLGQLLAQTFRHYNMHADALVPLPLHPQRQRDRGYNQAALLARVCATYLKIPCREDLVIRQRPTYAQVGLKADERRQNVADAFACQAKAGIHMYRTLVLIDDVSTTGSTLEACAAPLYAVGMREIWGLVLARPDNKVQDASKVML